MLFAALRRGNGTQRLGQRSGMVLGSAVEVLPELFRTSLTAEHGKASPTRFDELGTSDLCCCATWRTSETCVRRAVCMEVVDIR